MVPTRPRRARGRRAPAASGYPGRIRIIGGRWRSRRLPVTFAAGLRPTPDRVRETLFNWLAPWIEGARCVDLFAGTGALCLEALSRGAAEVVMVERDLEARRQLEVNVAALGAAGAQVLGLDALEYLAGRPAPFDIVFLDPPFADADAMVRACSERLARGWLRPGALIYVEVPRGFAPLPLPASWEPLKQGRAGQVGYHLVRAPG